MLKVCRCELLDNHHQHHCPESVCSDKKTIPFAEPDEDVI